MIRCPDNVAPQRREVRGGEFSIGRGQDNEWVIADPERHLSKKHCRLVYSGGDWELHDLSTNGTFLNQGSDPIGRGAVKKLRHGDRIKFGLYEIEVTIDEEGVSGRPGHAQPHSGPRPYHQPGLPPARSGIPESPAGLPSPFPPPAPDREPFQGPTQPDHAPALQSAFRPAPVRAAIIPDDWDVDLPGASSGRAPLAHAAARALPQDHPPAAGAVGDASLAAAFLRGAG